MVFFKNMGFFKKWGSIILLVLAGAFIGTPIMLITEGSADVTIIFMPLIGLIFLGLTFIILVWPFRCKSCKKWFAMKKTAKDYAGQQNSTFREQTGEIRDNSGNVTGSVHSDVAYTRPVYDLTYACKHCETKKTVRDTGKFKKK
ncbi:MAG: hypothetical protein LBC73_09045 [Oscillospiraceae bacterium]|jgi:hypothetical protein|nr:hypothetical protein [Oscillospiraceae bacterium]